MRRLAALIALIFAIPSTAIFAQTRVMNMTAIRNRPFTATESHTGPNFIGAVTQKIARNSEGSLYYQAPEGTIYIFDVTSKTRTTLFVTSRRYRVDAMPQLAAGVVSEEQVARMAARVDQARPVHVEQNGIIQDGHSIGTKNIQGFVAFGHLTTFKGTDEKANITDRTEEVWESPLVGVINAKTEDHVGGENSTMIRENFQMTEPDPALFQIPSGYLPEKET